MKRELLRWGENQQGRRELLRLKVVRVYAPSKGDLIRNPQDAAAILWINHEPEPTARLDKKP